MTKTDWHTGIQYFYLKQREKGKESSVGFLCFFMLNCSVYSQFTCAIVKHRTLCFVVRAPRPFVVIDVRLMGLKEKLSSIIPFQMDNQIKFWYVFAHKVIEREQRHIHTAYVSGIQCSALTEHTQFNRCIWQSANGRCVIRLDNNQILFLFRFSTFKDDCLSFSHLISVDCVLIRYSFFPLIFFNF